MKVSVVIPNWNGEEKLLRNLPIVLKVKGISEVIVSDDASTDNSVKIVETHFPQVFLIKRPTNGGFSVNVNTAVKRVTGDVIFLLNSDAVPDSDVLEFSLAHFDDPRVFSVGLNVGGNWSWARFKDGYFWHFESKETTSHSHQTLWASGGSGLFRKSIWDKLGGFDENFSPFYEEDTDLGYRATKRGYINIWEPKAWVEHYQEKGVIESNFSKRTVSLVAQRNQLILIWKNITDNELILQHLVAVIKNILKHPKYILIVIQALIKLPNILENRRIECRYSQITDQEIFEMFSS